MRPPNFPSVRLAQLAMLVQNSNHLFSKIKETETISEMRKLFSVTANDYWNYHYVFDEELRFISKTCGFAHDETTSFLIPWCRHYLRMEYILKDQKFKDKALYFLNEVKGELNSVT